MIDQRLLSDPTFLGGLAVAGTLLVLATVLLLRRPRPELIAAPLAQMVAELQGRLAQMSESQVATQAAVARRTGKQAFVWAMLACVVLAYQFSPAFFADAAKALLASSARAVHEERLPYAFYGLTYMPL